MYLSVLGYVISTAANSVNTALAIAPPLLVPLIMFGGFFLNSGLVYLFVLLHFGTFSLNKALVIALPLLVPLIMFCSI